MPSSKFFTLPFDKIEVIVHAYEEMQITDNVSFLVLDVKANFLIEIFRGIRQPIDRDRTRHCVCFVWLNANETSPDLEREIYDIQGCIFPDTKPFYF